MSSLRLSHCGSVVIAIVAIVADREPGSCPATASRIATLVAPMIATIVAEGVTSWLALALAMVVVHHGPCGFKC